MGSSSRPSLPTEILASWSAWRPLGLLTPPMSASLPRLGAPQVTSLPPIAHFDRQVSYMHPTKVTPPRTQDASSWSQPVHVPRASPEQLDQHVNQSVIVLSLHYIWRLKERNRFTAGLLGISQRQHVHQQLQDVVGGFWYLRTAILHPPPRSVPALLHEIRHLFLSSDMPTHMFAVFSSHQPAPARRRVTLFPEIHSVPSSSNIFGTTNTSPRLAPLLPPSGLHASNT
ncbi:hypothetical protein P692DRAFT_20869716 [Suillus brevipes Sb2]|nr:hypothetical protein P692DRAFT_20869716 [Suillus brevipes Sb2]